MEPSSPPQSQHADYAGYPPAPDANARSMGMACHLLGLVGFLGPLILWLVKKDEHPFIDDQGKEALNFQLSILIYSFISAILIFVLIGFLLLLFLCVFAIVMVVIAAMKANEGNYYRYPLCLRLVR